MTNSLSKPRNPDILNTYILNTYILIYFILHTYILNIVCCSFKSFPSLTFHAVNSTGENCNNCDSVNAVTWGVFTGREILQPTVVDPESFEAWREEAFEVYYLII